LERLVEIIVSFRLQIGINPVVARGRAGRIQRLIITTGRLTIDAEAASLCCLPSPPKLKA
jgi:hypothetical protein